MKLRSLIPNIWDKDLRHSVSINLINSQETSSYELLMLSFREITESLLHFCFPHICNGCGSDMLNKESSLCIRCIERLPATRFELRAANPIEKKFTGRIPIACGMAQYYFTPQSLLQQLMH